MNTPTASRRTGAPTFATAWPALAAGLGLLLAASPSPAADAPRSVDQHVAADPAGSVDITNVAGQVDLSGWDRPEVSVTGVIGEHVDRVEVTGSGTHVTVKVVERKDKSWGSWGDKGETRLAIKVPTRSAVEVNLVSADLKVGGLSGPARFETVSGDITGETDGELTANTVSGDLRLTARGAHEARVKTVSGDLQLEGPSGNLDVGSVSGSAQLVLGTLTRLHAETVSGDLRVKTALAPNGQVEVSSVSGDVTLEFASVPDADVDVSAFSGEVNNCFGPKAQHEEYGPGTHLDFRSGKGGGRIRVNTHSGDVSLCTRH